MLVTLIVLAASRSGRLQAIMSSNTRDRDLAFQAAEAALLDAETRLPGFHANNFQPGVALAGLIDRSTASTELKVAASTADYWVSPLTPCPMAARAIAGSTPTARSTAASRSRAARRSRAWTSSPLRDRIPGHSRAFGRLHGTQDPLPLPHHRTRGRCFIRDAQAG